MNISRPKYWFLGILASVYLFACNNANNEPNTYVASKNENIGAAAPAVFTAKCALCHDLDKDKIGPALAGTVKRWNNDQVRLKSFIKNAQQVIAGGDAYASTLFQKWHNATMPTFTNLTDQELDELVDYIK